MSIIFPETLELDVGEYPYSLSLDVPLEPTKSLELDVGIFPYPLVIDIPIVEQIP